MLLAKAAAPAYLDEVMCWSRFTGAIMHNFYGCFQCNSSNKTGWSAIKLYRNQLLIDFVAENTQNGRSTNI